MHEILTAKGLCARNIIFYPDLSISEGHFTFVTGESGCGKSSLFRLLNATELPSAGSVCYRGAPVAGRDVIAYRRAVSLVPQEIFLLEGSIRENFAFYFESRGEAPPDDPILRTVLGVCQADFPLETNCAALSGGERQRVFVAIFLSFSPDVLLLDEPTSALDESTAAALLSRIKVYCRAQGITPVAICHSAGLVHQFADHIIPLGKGALP